MRRLLFLLFLFVLCATLPGRAEGGFLRFCHKVKNYVDSADYKGTEPGYLYRPPQGFVAYTNAYFTGTHINGKYDVSNLMDGKSDLKASLNTRLATMFSAGLSYRGWGLSYSADYSRYDDSEWCFMSYGRTRGLELRIHRANSLSGPVTMQYPGMSRPLEVEANDFRQRTALVNFYWVFNDKRFSLPAAMTHTVVQLRSAGSWLAFANYRHSSLRVTANNDLSQILGKAAIEQGLNERSDFNRMSQSQVSVGGGYAYNLAFAQGHCLLHSSFTPMVSVWHRNRAYYLDYQKAQDGSWELQPGESDIAFHQKFTVNGAMHLNFIYNSMGRWLAGAMGVMNIDWLPGNYLTLYTFDWSVRCFVGFRF